MNLSRFRSIRNGGGNGGMEGLFAMITSLVFGTMGFYLLAWKNLDETSDRFKLDQRGDIFDFIIVGAGSSGAVVANRLSKNYSVLLLEAGGEPSPLHAIPILATSLINYRETDWQHLTVPQKHSFFAQNHHECLLSAGKSLGGTSTINFLMHNRGSPKDYDNWAKLLDDPSWSYDKVLPYFKKSECFIGEYKAGSGPEDLHGSEGEMTVQLPEYTGLGDLYLEAAKEMGYPVTDLNGRFNQGFDYVYYPMKQGRRVSTNTAFLKPIRDRRNLVVRKYSEVTRILFKENTTEAYGVEYFRHGIKKQALASREVVLSAGAINSPKLLMLSGIGPKENLESVGIEVLKDLPSVGKNLQDHTAVYLGPFFINQTKGFILQEHNFNVQSFVEYMTKGIGVFGTSSIFAQGFISSSLAQSEGQEDWPDVHLVVSGSSICKSCIKSLARAFNFKQEVMAAYYDHAVGKASFTQGISNARPKSRGEIRLKSSNPAMPALIDPSYLDNPHDIRIMVEGIKKAIELVENSTIFAKIGTHFTTEAFPGCHEEVFRSDLYWECYVRQFTVSLHHLVGSCGMGKGEDGGVVDSKLKVFGTERLRVIDASVIPVLPVGNTNWPAIMIGEKGAQIILDFWESSMVETGSDGGVGNEDEQNNVIPDPVLNL